MFESVAAAPAAAPGRRVASLALSLLLNGSMLGAALLLGQQVSERALPEPEPVRLTFLDLAPSAPPGPASAPAARPRRAPEAAPAAPAAPAPSPEPAPVAAVDPALAAAAGPTSGELGGPEGGGEGEGEGATGGGGGGGGGARAVHWSEVKVKRRVEPRFPEAALSLGLTEERCRLRITIDARGEPSDVDVITCNAVFQPSALEAAWAWRFYPMKVNGQGVPAAFDLLIVYRQR